MTALVNNTMLMTGAVALRVCFNTWQVYKDCLALLKPGRDHEAASIGSSHSRRLSLRCTNLVSTEAYTIPPLAVDNTAQRSSTAPWACPEAAGTYTLPLYWCS